MISRNTLTPVVLACGLIIFAASSVRTAFNKPLWGDETYGIATDIRDSTALRLLSHGARGQGSPAPLYYLIGKVADRIHLLVPRLPDVVFWRMTALAPTLLAAFALYRLRPASAPPLMFALAAICLVFSFPAFYFATEARPYALWLMFSTCIVGLLFQREATYAWPLAFSGLALTANISFFQMAALGAAVVAAYHLVEQKIPQRGEFLAGLSIGLAVAAYYSLRAGTFGYGGPDWGTWVGFGHFAKSYKWPIVGSLLLAYLSYRDSDAPWLSAALVAILWFAMSPFIYWLTRHRGFFFDPRQYIYWTTTTVYTSIGLLCWVKRHWAREPTWPLWVYVLAMCLAGMSLRRLEIHLLIGRLLSGTSPLFL